MPRKNFTDRTLKALKPIFPKGHKKQGQRLGSAEHYDVGDSLVPGLGVRVSGTGRKTFVLVAHYPGSKNPTRRALGEYSPLTAAEKGEALAAYSALPESERAVLSYEGYLLRTYGARSLAGAREKARLWLELVRRGVDPAIEAEREKAAELRKQQNSFAAVAEDFIRDKLPGERKGAEVERDIRRVFIPAWVKRPISDISALEIRNLIVNFRDRPAQAHNLLGHARRLFTWAIDQQVYGLEASPCDRLKPKALIGEKAVRTRVLNDAELRAVWRAAEKTGYPYGPLFRLLLLTGQRKEQVAKARWSEIDLGQNLWRITVEQRMKAAAAAPNIMPLSADAVALLKTLRRFNSGDYRKRKRPLIRR